MQVMLDAGTRIVKVNEAFTTSMQMVRSVVRGLAT
jgi:hypothetical protein